MGTGNVTKTAAQAPLRLKKADAAWLSVMALAIAVAVSLASTSAASAAVSASANAMSSTNPLIHFDNSGKRAVDRTAADTIIHVAQQSPVPVSINAINLQSSNVNRFLLTGVVNSSSGQGVALISVDRQAAQPFHTGQQVGLDHQLQSVSAGQAVLVQSTGTPVKLQLHFPGGNSSDPGVVVSAAKAQFIDSKPPAGQSQPQINTQMEQNNILHSQQTTTRQMSAENSLAQVNSENHEVKFTGRATPAEYTGPPPRADSRYRK